MVVSERGILVVVNNEYDLYTKNNCIGPNTFWLKIMPKELVNNFLDIKIHKPRKRNNFIKYKE